MNKSNNILDFYVNNNKNKYLIENEGANLSIAANKVLACIAALGYDSEYPDVNFNLDEVIKMILLKNLDYTMLSNRKEYKKYINKLNDNQSIESNIANACINASKNLDVKIINGVISELYNNYMKLSKTTREAHIYWNVSNDRKENVLEHIYGTLLIALGIESEYNYLIDYNKLYKTLLLHETDEILIGDEIVYDKKAKKIEESQKAEETILGELKKSKEYLKLLVDYRNKRDVAMEYAHMINKLEYDLQVKMYDMMGNYNITNLEINNDKIKQIINNGSSSVFDIHYECDKDSYVRIPCIREILEKAKKL